MMLGEGDPLADAAVFTVAVGATRTARPLWK
jgi:hypothetical protein